MTSPDSPPPEEGALVKREDGQTEIDEGMDEFVKEAPPEVRKLLKEAPPQVRKSFMGMIMKTSMGGALPHPLYDKFTPEHIATLLTNTEKENERGFKFACQGRWFAIGSAILVLAFISFLIIYLLPANKELLTDLLRFLVVFAGGVGAGIGWKSRK